MIDNRPVILFVAPYFAPACHGGVVQVYLGLLARSKKFRVVVVADLVNTTLEAASAWDKEARERYGFTVERINAFEFHMTPRDSSPLMKTFGGAFDLFRFFGQGIKQWKSLCRKYEPATVICGGTYSAGWLMAWNPPSARLINYVHGEELTMNVRPRFLLPLMRAWQGKSLRKAYLNLAVSSYTAKLINRQGGKTVVFPNFVDHKRFVQSDRREQLRKNFGWDDELIFLTVARLEPRKGIDRALRALAQLRDGGKLQGTWRYVIGGRGTEHEALVGIVKRLNLTANVTFLGFVPDKDLIKLYQAADIFLQPNREIDGDTEGFGIVFLEANACGLPVIGGKAGGTADAIDHGRSGFRVDGDSVDEIADAIASLSSNTALRKQLSLQAVQWAGRFDVEDAASRFEMLLQNVIDHDAAPSTLSVGADVRV